MKVNCDEEVITIIGDGFRINIDVEEGLELANKISKYYIVEEKISKNYVFTNQIANTISKKIKYLSDNNTQEEENDD